MNDFSAEPRNDTIDITKLQPVSSSLMWYVALLPAFAIFFEMYADSRLLGAFLWGLVIAVRIGVCIFDNKKLMRMGLWRDGKVTPLVLLPVMYIGKRLKIIHRPGFRSGFLGGLAVACVYLAATGNGFVEAMGYEDEDYCELVSSYYATYITNLPDDEDYFCDSYQTISDLIAKYCMGEGTKAPAVEYEFEERGEEKTVTASSEMQGIVYEFEFLIDFDGYYYSGCELREVRADGEALTDDELEQLMKDAFMHSVDEYEE